MPQKLKIFLAGATGYTGTRLLPLLKDQDVTAHLRPESKNFDAKKAELSRHGAKVLASKLSDTKNLAQKLKGYDALISLIGTTRAQFDATTSYETADYGANKDLIAIAKAAGIKRFILLSSVGAGNPVGPYLQVKKRIEDELIASGLSYVILRPSFLTGEGRRGATLLEPLFKAASLVAKNFAAAYKPIDTAHLARILQEIIENPCYQNCILEGSSLWDIPVDN